METTDILLPKAIISGLPHRLHEGKELELRPINYLFGANGSGKTLSLKCITRQAKDKIRVTRLNENGYFAQYITATPQQNFYQDHFPFLDGMASDFDLGNDDITGQAFYQHLQDFPEIVIRVRDALQKYLGRYPNVIRRGTNNVMSFLREEENFPAYSPQQESDGLRRLSLLLSYIYHPKCKFLAIDEPELFLHPDMISFILEEILSETANDKQFALVTHSPEMIRIGSGDIYAYLYFNLKDKLADTHIIQANEVGATSIIEKLGYLLDVNRRAFLYAPTTLFVEGICDEVVYYKLKMLEKVSWSRRIFMVNTGGVSNIFDFWKLWTLFDKDTRVLIDNPKDNKQADSVNAAISQFCKEFGIDESASLDNKTSELEKHNIIIAPYPDVLVFDTKNIDIKDIDAIIGNLDVSTHAQTLEKAIKIDEPKQKQIRKEESEWLISLAQEIFGEAIKNSGDMTSLQKAKEQLELQHPNITIQLGDDEGYPIKISFRVSRDRRINIDLGKETLKTSSLSVDS